MFLNNFLYSSRILKQIIFSKSSLFKLDFKVQKLRQLLFVNIFNYHTRGLRPLKSCVYNICLGHFHIGHILNHKNSSTLIFIHDLTLSLAILIFPKREWKKHFEHPLFKLIPYIVRQKTFILKHNTILFYFFYLIFLFITNLQ